MPNLKLEIELVPASCFYSNVRSEVSRKQWDHIRRKVYHLANHACQICGGVGRRHAVEAHEVWDYVELPSKNIQRLIAMVALCPSCHRAKHFGLAEMRGELIPVIDHLLKVNQCTPDELFNHIQQSKREWARRSMLDWELDISYLDEFLK